MPSLSRHQQLRQGIFDVLIVGGGINGAVSAAALSAKGLKVALVDGGDFAGETSSSSSCLVWGGIKFLQSFEITLVRNLCRSRNTLMQAYPHLVPEVRYLAALDPIDPFRSSWAPDSIGSSGNPSPASLPSPCTRCVAERPTRTGISQKATPTSSLSSSSASGIVGPLPSTMPAPSKARFSAECTTPESVIRPPETPSR
ncbi:MAG: FAD-dependent oxidoreductase [Akkermansiaceae bacterium]